MTKPFRPFIVAAIICAMLASPCSAWNKAGHSVIAAIAFDTLKRERPETVAKIVAILKQHPQWATFEKRLESVPEEDRERYLFMIAARWADDIRGNPEFDHPYWHFISIPYYPDGKPPATLPTTAPTTESTTQPDLGNVVTALESNLTVLKSNAPDSEKAVAICWIFHLVGDVHQPLHAIGSYSEQFPEGDRGGNRMFVRFTVESPTINLHALWDGLIIGSDRYQDCRNRAIELRNDPALALGKLPELKAPIDFDRWARVESYELARRVVYREGKLRVGSDVEHGELLPADYAKTAQPVAERRAVLAGYRLAIVVRDALGG